SVFVGASGSKASPHVLLLVRAVKRELTLAEHRASDARMVSPVFAPSSQRIFFNSDRHGKPAIYSMQIERLVEQTEDTAKYLYLIVVYPFLKGAPHAYDAATHDSRRSRQQVSQRGNSRFNSPKGAGRYQTRSGLFHDRRQPARRLSRR